MGVSLLSVIPAAAAGQGIADIDYEHLSFRGFGFDVGYLWPDRVEPTQSFAARSRGGGTIFKQELTCTWLR